MRINPINNQSKNNTNFKANLRFSTNFNQYYTPSKLDEVTKTIHYLGSVKDSVNLTLNKLKPGWEITSLSLINNEEFKTYSYDNSRYAVLRNTLDSLREHFKSAYGQNYKNIDGQSEIIPETNFIKQESKTILPQKSTQKPSEKTIEKGLSKEIEELINNKIEEKIKNLIETKLETIIEKTLLKQIESNKKVQGNIQEIIQESTDEVGKALVKLSKEYTNSVNDTNHPQRGLLGELHNELSKLLELANSNYEGGI